MKYSLLFLIFFTLYFVSCADTSQKTGPSNGTLNGNCFTNGTCNDGLSCQNNKCIENKCINKNCDEWLECNPSSGKCDNLKEGFCSQNSDCNTEANETCNKEHKCKVPEVENCTINGNECSNNEINTACNEETLKCEPIASDCDPACETWQECSSGMCLTKSDKCKDDSDCNNQTCNENHECTDEDLCANSDCSADINSECNSATGNCDCKTDFHLENNNNECLPNEKDVNCKKPDIENSDYKNEIIKIKWMKDKNKWSDIPECKWTCKEGFYKKPKDSVSVESNDFTCEACSCEAWETCEETGNCSLTPGRCQDDSSCREGNICDENHNCVNDQDPCDGITCGGHGDCRNLNGTAICICNEDGYFDDGSLNCVNPCDNKTCSGHGDCEATTILNAHCKCDENYFADGFNCISPCTGHWGCNNSSIVIDDNPNDDVTKANTNPVDTPRGTCSATDINTATCTCITGYEDTDNDLICTSVCTGVSCNGHGDCTIIHGEASCNCNPGYAKPSNDSLECYDIDECTEGLDNCDPHATCNNNSGSFTCTCNEGYEGNGEHCIPIDNCNGSCDYWEHCDNGQCKANAGRCNTPTDCSGQCNGQIDPIMTNSTIIDPNIKDCTCNIDTHRCELVNP